MLAYGIDLALDDNGPVLVTCPDLPEVISFGENEDDARRHAVDAIEEALAARIAYKQAIPPPSRKGSIAIRLPVLTAARVSRYQNAA